MKKIDIKSLLIGILLGTNLMFLFGAKTMDCDDNYYEIRKVKRTVNDIESAINSVSSDVYNMRYYGVDCN
ncbi:MAG TPA: hypothetical protein EYO18_08605 [Candidatus Marinimicrobia bacterium]|nr:hypothetical protein [Candidatus Neomarinimicrobiota bacterium]